MNLEQIGGSNVAIYLVGAACGIAAAAIQGGWFAALTTASSLLIGLSGIRGAVAVYTGSQTTPPRA
ncbi:MAG: hypothetical protein F9K29_18050 [Hyphomicrobiaceae bacterium]|nr:MAG: hypothetical protein F9K29_18050 [Hyphomicrobiaceae bacterium]